MNSLDKIDLTNKQKKDILNNSLINKYYPANKSLIN